MPDFNTLQPVQDNQPDFSTLKPIDNVGINQNTKPSIVGTLLKPTMEGIQGLKTLYGGGEQGIANKLLTDVQSGASDIQQGNVLKGIAKSGFRTAGDVAGAVYAPVGAAIGATGIGKVFDYLGELSQKGGGYNPINLITDSKIVQDFVMAHPNLEEDLGRALNIVFAKAETGQIDPKTVIPRTITQIEAGLSKAKAIPGQVMQPIKSITGNLPEDIINKRVKELENISGNYAQLRKESNFNPEKVKESVKRVASTDVLVNSVDENGLIRTKEPGGAVDQYTAQTLDNAENIVRRNLERLGEKVSLDEVQTRLEDAVNKSGLEGADLKVALNKVKKEIAGYRLKADQEGNVPLTLIHDAKIATTKKIRDFTTPSEVKTYEKALGEGLKTTVEKNSTFNVKEVNGELSKYLQDIKFLEQLDGKKVKGGKLGKYFAQISGNIIGGAIGGAVGGPAGTALGSIAGGELASKIKSSMLERTLGGKTGYVAPENPIIKKAIETADYLNKDGNLNAQYQTPNNVNSSENINQNANINNNITTDNINSVSNRIIGNTIPQKSSIIQKIKQAYKNSPISSQKGGINTKLKPKFTKLSPEVQDNLMRTLSDFDSTPLTINGKIDLTDSSLMFRLDELKNKVNKGKMLTRQEQNEAFGLLKEIGIDVSKIPVKKVNTYIKNPTTGKFEGSKTNKK